jgi:flagellar biosynthesis protein FlhA
VAGVPPVDPLRLELGAGLLTLASDDGAGLTTQVRALRRQIATETGVLVPPVRIVDNLALPALRYRILLRDTEMGAGEARPGRLLAIGPAGTTPPPGAEPVKEPVFKLDAAWVDPALRTMLEVAGNTVVDSATILATHLSETVRGALPDLMTQAETQALMEALPPREQRIFTDLVPAKMDMALVHQTLLALVRERVSIRDMPLVLEALHDAAGQAGRALTPARAAARVRLRLGRQIAQANLSPGGHLAAIIPGPDRERVFHDALAQDPDGPVVLAPDVAAPFLDALDAAVAQTRDRGDVPVLVASDSVRSGVRGLLAAWRRDLPVLAAGELPPGIRVQVAARI